MEFTHPRNSSVDESAARRIPHPNGSDVEDRFFFRRRFRTLVVGVGEILVDRESYGYTDRERKRRTRSGQKEKDGQRERRGRERDRDLTRVHATGPSSEPRPTTIVPSLVSHSSVSTHTRTLRRRRPGSEAHLGA